LKNALLELYHRDAAAAFASLSETKTLDHRLCLLDA